MAIDGVNNKQMKTQQSNEDFGAFADNGLFFIAGLTLIGLYFLRNI